MAKNWLRYITPLTVLAIVLACMAAFAAVNKKLAGDAKAILNVAEVIIIIPAIIIDIVLRLVFKTKTAWLWVVEAIIIVIFCFVFIKK